MVTSALEDNEPLALDRDLQGAEVVLQRLADQLVETDGAKLAGAFQAFDKDGSGYLDAPELCAAVRQVRPFEDGSSFCLLFCIVLIFIEHV